MEFKFEIVNFEKSTGGGLQIEAIYDVNELIDDNTLYGIKVSFDDTHEQDKFDSSFPKYCKVRHCGPLTTVFYFDTFFSNKKTGDVNEAAIKRRTKILEVIKKL